VLFLIPHPFSRPQHLQPIWEDPEMRRAEMYIAERAGFTSAIASRMGTQLKFFCDPTLDRSRLGEGSHLFVNVTGEPLQQGDTMTLTYGDTRNRLSRQYFVSFQ